MKKWLICCLLVTVHHTASGDARLDFLRYTPEGRSLHFSYLIKNQRLRLVAPGSQRFNLFDSQQQAFISLNLQNGNMARMDKRILAQRASQLNHKRLQRLEKIYQEMDKKRPTMSEKEWELTEEVKTQMKYPDQYGTYTLNKLEKTTIQQKIANINCQLYTLKRKNKHLKNLCIANRKQLGISTHDFATLQAYEEFNYQTQSQIMLAMGDANFELVSLKEQQINGVIIKEESIQNKASKTQLVLTKVSTQEIDEEQLKLPKIKKSQLE